MSTEKKSKLAPSLRSIAKDLRNKGTENQKGLDEKCAHVLIATNGLALLQKRIMEGQNA